MNKLMIATLLTFGVSAFAQDHQPPVDPAAPTTTTEVRKEVKKDAHGKKVSKKKEVKQEVKKEGEGI